MSRMLLLLLQNQGLEELGGGCEGNPRFGGSDDGGPISRSDTNTHGLGSEEVLAEASSRKSTARADPSAQRSPMAALLL